MVLEDKSFMPFGKYKGDRMENVPAKYLLWLWETGKYSEEVGEYIEDNLDVLKKEIEE